MGMISSYCPKCGKPIGWFITPPPECKHCKYAVTEKELWNTYVMFSHINDRYPTPEEVLEKLNEFKSFD